MSRYLPDFAGVVCLVVFLISLATVNDGLLSDGDSFWHIKVGSVMLQQHSLVDRDIFSYTAYGTPWTAHEWLSELIMASINKVAGLEGITCFFILINALTFWLLYRITEKQTNQLVAFGCVTMAMIFSQTHLVARPHLFTWLFMLIVLSILTTEGKRLFWLPIIMVVWANLHGGFVIGLALQVIFIVGAGLESHLNGKITYREVLQQQKMPILILFLSILAIGLNPFGYELLMFPFKVSKGVFSQLISEWHAPNLQEMWYFRIYLVLLLLLISMYRSAITWTERLLIAFFLNAALTHMRHVSLMFIGLAPFIARMIQNHLVRWRRTGVLSGDKQQIQLSRKSGPLITITIAVILLIAGSIDHRSLEFLSPEKIFKVQADQLSELVSFLDKSPPRGNMFNEYMLGGYLLFALTPPPKVFIDGRADMYGEQILSDYQKIVSSDKEREKLLDQYHIDWIVFEKDSDLVSDLKRAGTWQMNFLNDYYAVLSRVEIDNRID